MQAMERLKTDTIRYLKGFSTMKYELGKIDHLFTWERIHLRDMTSEYANDDILSFYPIDIVFLGQ